jgi:hypothetical protein
MVKPLLSHVHPRLAMFLESNSYDSTEYTLFMFGYIVLVYCFFSTELVWYLESKKPRVVKETAISSLPQHASVRLIT